MGQKTGVVSLTTMRETGQDSRPVLEGCLNHFQPYLTNPDGDVTDIAVNEFGRFWVTREKYHPHPVEQPGLNAQWLDNFAVAAANYGSLRYSSDKPMLRTTLPGRHRLALMAGPTVPTGVSLSIRLYRDIRYKPKDFGLIGDDVARFQALFRDNHNLLISGATGSGKTKLMILGFSVVPLEKRFLVIEDTAGEIDLNQSNRTNLVIPSSGQPNEIGFPDIVDHAMRSSPDRIVVSEISQHNAHPVVRFLNTGHGGFCSSIHADHPEGALQAWLRNIAGGHQNALASDYYAITSQIHAVIHVGVTVRVTKNRKSGADAVERHRVARIKLVKDMDLCALGASFGIT